MKLDDLADAVRRVAAGGSVIDPEVVARLLGRPRSHSPLDELTPREREILGLMAEGRSNAAIAERLTLELRTVEGHVRTIFSKLRPRAHDRGPPAGPGRPRVPARLTRRHADGRSRPRDNAAMGTIIDFDDLSPTRHSHEFVGAEHGDVPFSVILVHSRPGVGPKLHRHPYAEVFVVESGQATFRIGDDEIVVEGGHVVVSPPGEAHGFTNTGSGELRLDRDPRRRALRHRVAGGRRPGLDVEAEGGPLMVAPIHHQVVVYAADPQRLARFWAAAMGYELENNEVMIEPLLAAGVAQESDTVVVDGQRFWDGILAIRHPDDPVDERTGIVHGRRILFELQETEKADENRVHLDLNVGKDRIDEETERIVGLGATLLYERRDAPRAVFNRLTDPEGNEFCIQ